MSSKRLALAFVVPLASMLACQGQPRSSMTIAARRLAAAGCYTLQQLDSSTRGVDRLASFRLLTNPVSSQRTSPYRVELLVHDGTSVERLGVITIWSLDSLTDTVRVQLGDGFTGQFFAGVPHGPDLVGLSGAFGDAGPPFTFNVRPTRARHTTCLAATDHQPLYNVPAAVGDLKNAGLRSPFWRGR